ncbi:hypothetical protein MTR_4g071147 [Medicago truncatula]|uniref:Uncharacterized protein n=1 Tax=Medicago truncatula TaxID=3880 RepID=A0A072UX67_MEDTR|nr:hypothetical protein MTR_4g071147 [Medicago truncatula]
MEQVNLNSTVKKLLIYESIRTITMTDQSVTPVLSTSAGLYNSLHTSKRKPERSQNVLSDLPDLESTVALLAHEITSCDELYNLQPTSDDVMSFCSSDVMLK